MCGGVYELMYLTNKYIPSLGHRSYLVLKNSSECWVAYCEIYTGTNLFSKTRKYLGNKKMIKIVTQFVWKIVDLTKTDMTGYQLRKTISCLKLNKIILSESQLAELNLFASPGEFTVWNLDMKK